MASSKNDAPEDQEPKENKSKKPNPLDTIKKKWPAFKERATGTEGIVYGAVIFALLFIVVIIVQSYSPRKGDITYVICNEFLNLHVPYPHTLQRLNVEMYRKAARIEYTFIDAFGAFNLNMIECSFKQDPEKGMVLDNVVFRDTHDIAVKQYDSGRGVLYVVKSEVLELFNRSRSPSAMMTADPDDTIKEVYTDGLKILPYPGKN